LPFHIPFALGLLDADGTELLDRADGVRIDSAARIARAGEDGTVIVELEAPETRLRVSGLAARPVVSALRGFSAPILLDADTSTEDLYFLARHDSDGFARWDAMQRLLAGVLENLRLGHPLTDEPIDLCRELLSEALTAPDDGEHKAMLAMMLALPAEQYLYQLATEIDVEGIHAARLALARQLGERLFDRLLAVYTANHHVGSYTPDGPGIARRSLANGVAAFLVAAEYANPARIATLLTSQLERADNLTDRLAALRGIVRSTTFDETPRAELLARFYERWAKDKLVVDQWFSVQAASPREGALARIRALERHPAFDTRNPNRARSLYATFAANLPHFHAADGEGYRFLAERCVALDAANPQLAARLMKSLTQWQRHTAARKRAMLDALRGAANAKLSKDTYEVVTKGLEG
jgi:aminopeptidase N